MTTINFGRNSRNVTGNQYVYLKQTWNSDWLLYPDLHCTQATWCLSPSMPTATLEYDYGWVKGIGSRFYSALDKLDCLGWYVKVVMNTDLVRSESNTWYGVVSHIEDDQKGIEEFSGSSRASGRQVLHCYGLEKLLDTEYIAESWVDKGEVAPRVVQLPITFNRGGKPNRNARDDWYAFEAQPLHVSPTLSREAEWWSTFHIAKYLAQWVVPKESFRTRIARVPFRVQYADRYLPKKDHPVVEQEGQTVLAILNRLIDRRRLRSFYCDVDTSVTPNVVNINVVAWNANPIILTIPDSDLYLENTNTRTLLYDYSQATSSTLRKTDVKKYDRIVVRGARRTSTATWVVDTNGLETKWDGSDESAYEAGSSGVTGYGTWDEIKKIQRNAEVRSADSLACVYSWFGLDDAWTGDVVAADSGTTSHVFVDIDGMAVDFDIYETEFLPYVPLYEQVDYSGSIISGGTAAVPFVDAFRQPSVYFKIPTDDRWVAGDSVATMMGSSCDPVDDGRNYRWSALCRAQNSTRTLEVKVSGEEQHVIADSDFTPLSEDRELGDFDYNSKKMAITAAILDNRYTEGKYPPDGTSDTTFTDQQFGFVIYAGDDYRQDYVVPNTIVDVDEDGALVKSTGGFVRDDTDKLEALARVTYEWWNQDRIILTLRTSQLTSAIQVGDLIDTIGDPSVADGHYETVNTVVSELRITWPILEGNQKDTPILQFTTGAGELDPMTIAPPHPDKRKSGPRR